MKNYLFVLALALPMLFVSCGGDDSPTPPPEEIEVTVLTIQEEVYNGTVLTVAATAIGGDTKEATFYFDGKSIGSFIAKPYILNYRLKDVTPGGHKITCVVKSMQDNEFTGETRVTLKLRVGDEYQGGKIFKLNADGRGGLIAAKDDLSYTNISTTRSFRWAETQQVSHIGTNLTDGKSNTAKMVASTLSTPNAGYAAWHFINGYHCDGFNDWYIPSITELEVLLNNKLLIGNFPTAITDDSYYWSSSETSELAYALHSIRLFRNAQRKDRLARVRPIRRF